MEQNFQKIPAWLVNASNEVVPSLLSDKDLYLKCREYGLNAKTWSRRFAGLLPEVAKRGLHRRKGFVSIHEFAGKLAGMSEYAVDRILNLAKNLERKPVLKKLFESGECGWSKILKVAAVSTTETDKFWAEKLQLLSAAALEAYVQNYRRKSVPMNISENEPRIGQEARTEFEPPVRFSFPASRDLEFDLRVAKQKLEKNTKQTLSWNETFQMIIKKTDFEQFCVKCKKGKACFKICEDCRKKLGAGGGHG